MYPALAHLLIGEGLPGRKQRLEQPWVTHLLPLLGRDVVEKCSCPHAMYDELFVAAQKYSAPFVAVIGRSEVNDRM